MEGLDLTLLIEQLEQVNSYLEVFKWLLGFISGLLVSQLIAKGFVRHG